MDAKMKNEKENFAREMRRKLATLSTNTLLRYYKDIKSNIIPSDLSIYIEYLTIPDLLENIEKELSVRGALKKIKKINIF